MACRFADVFCANRKGRQRTGQARHHGDERDQAEVPQRGLKQQFELLAGFEPLRRWCALIRSEIVSRSESVNASSADQWLRRPARLSDPMGDVLPGLVWLDTA